MHAHTHNRNTREIHASMVSRHVLLLVVHALSEIRWVRGADNVHMPTATAKVGGRTIHAQIGRFIIIIVAVDVDLNVDRFGFDVRGGGGNDRCNCCCGGH